MCPSRPLAGRGLPFETKPVSLVLSPPREPGGRVVESRVQAPTPRLHVLLRGMELRT